MLIHIEDNLFLDFDEILFIDSHGEPCDLHIILKNSITLNVSYKYINAIKEKFKELHDY